jgi:hypothetical protein
MEQQISQQKIYNAVNATGIYRDWTINSSPGYTDGVNCRFYHGRAKKIGGWQEMGDIGLTPNNTYFTNDMLPYSGTNAIEFGEIRAIKMYPISERFIVVVAVDVLNVSPTLLSGFNPNIYNIPTGLFIGITNDTLTETINFYPIRFQSNYSVATEGGPLEIQNFQPDAYNWHISFYGTTSGGEGNPSPLTGIKDSPLSSMALVVHAESTLQDKMNTKNNYAYFAYLSDLVDFSNEDQYVQDISLSTAVVSPTPSSVISDPRYYFAPMMFPMTSLPVGGFYDPADPLVPSPTPIPASLDNPYLIPQPFDSRAIYCTDEIYVSGGVTSVGAFLFAYGNNGLIRNCSANNPSVWFNNSNQWYNYNPGLANDDNMDNYKIVHAMPVRGGAGTSTLAWTSNSLWLIQFTGASGTFFSYTNISNSVSILSANSVVEQNGIYYWIGEDNFYIYSGTVQIMPNNHNFIWFYENLNYINRAKIWTFKNPRFSEIWWVFPKGNSSEPNWALVYNYQENFWYDTPWNRTAGTYDNAFYEPLCCGSRINSPVEISFVDGTDLTIGSNINNFNFIPVWVHERGYNEVNRNNIVPIESYIITGDIGYTKGIAGNKTLEGITNNTFLARIDPDSAIVGNQYIQALPREFPLSEDIVNEDNIRYYDGNDIDNYVTFSNIQGRLIRLKYGCNELDSTFYLGTPLITMEPGDMR